jgi:ABC-type sugar transport system permease subunit
MSVALPVESPRAHRRRRFRQKQIIPYLFVLPNLVIFGVFLFGPTVYSFAMSFTSWNGLGSPEFNGLDNYRRMLTEPIFRASLRNTFVYTAGTVLPMTVLALGLAIMLNTALRGRVFLRTLIYLPVVISWVAGAFIWQLIFLHPAGFMNEILGFVGIEPQVWTRDPQLVLPAIIGMSIWKGLGFYMVIFLAGLQTIPDTFYEAAALDGAGKWSMFKDITLPLLRPTTLFVLVVGVIGSFEVFIPIFILTAGGPGYSSMVLVMAIYRFGFTTYEMGYASAIAVVLFLIILVVSILQIKLFGREVQY